MCEPSEIRISICSPGFTRWCEISLFSFGTGTFFAKIAFRFRFTSQNESKIAGSTYFGKLKTKQKYRSEGAL